MRNLTILQPVVSFEGMEDPLAAALAILNAGLLADAPAVLEALARAGFTAQDEQLQPVIIEIIFQLLEAFDADPASPVAWVALDGIAADVANVGSDLLILANSPDGECALGDLPDATIFCLAGLFTRAGRVEDSLNLLRGAVAERPNTAFMTGAYRARCHAFAVSGDISSLWIGHGAEGVALDAALAGKEARPLDPASHQIAARRLAEAGRYEDAVAAFSVGLALPIGEEDKREIVVDLAVLATFLRAHGRAAALLSAPRVRLALSACPKSAAHAEAALHQLSGGAHAAFDPDSLADVRSFFHDFAASNTPAYPMLHGKPRVDTVWLEITNFCNQKCTFCPDMHREDARTWLPLAEVKRLIDELADTVSVGSMQLNAYGEPLLHPHISEILAYIREKQLPWPTFFTSHGMTLVDKKLAQLSHNYPGGIAISLHNDSQQSYEATRSAKIGDYETLVTRVTALLSQMVDEGAACHMRLYQMVCNGNEDERVDPKVRAAFPDTAERMTAHVRKWEEIAAAIAAAAPSERQAVALVNTPKQIEKAFLNATHGDGNHLPILHWRTDDGRIEHAFMSPRPVGTYANLLLEYHPDWQVERKVVSAYTCGFIANPSLAIFATGKLGICCLDMNSTATFGSLSDYGSLSEALTSPEATRMFAQLSNGVATSRGCQICLGTGKQMCGK